VRMTCERLPRHEAQHCLDAGCGRGGTAALVQSNRWGQVTGMDIDEETISFAASAYPAVEFVAADVISAGELFPGRFDIIYAFNAFYARSLSAVQGGAQLSYSAKISAGKTVTSTAVREMIFGSRTSGDYDGEIS